MKIANVRLSWFPSVSDDVITQTLVIKFNGEVAAEETLSPQIDLFDVRVPEKTSVTVELTASDTENTSVPAILDFRIGDLEVPVSPQFMSPGFEILSVVDSE